VPLADHEQIDAVGRFLFDRGIYVTLAAYPLVPKDEVGFRVQVTAANTDEQITSLNRVLGELADRFPLQPAVVDAAEREERAA
jgi:8-amino-7-oxononanoate synthase